MAFKAVSGVNKNVYSTYTSDQTSSEKVFAALEVTNRHFNHYKNRIVLKWQDIGPSEVLLLCYILFLLSHCVNKSASKMLYNLHDRPGSLPGSQKLPQVARGPRESMWKRT